jgi:hypothetical protein
MKTKSIILLSVCAIVTLSFTFVSAKKAAPSKPTKSTVHTKSGSNSGGFILEDKMI